MRTETADPAREQKLVRARRTALRAANLLTFFGGAVFGLAELWAWFSAYASFTGGVVIPTAGEITAIQICAAGSVSAALVSVVLALVARGRWAAFFGSLSTLGLIAAIVLAVILTSHPATAPTPPGNGPALPSTFHPCFSGSNTCN